jgi:hypothetical protein
MYVRDRAFIQVFGEKFRREETRWEMDDRITLTDLNETMREGVDWNCLAQHGDQ